MDTKCDNLISQEGPDGECSTAVLSDEFKAEAVKLVKESGMTISEAGRR